MVLFQIDEYLLKKIPRFFIRNSVDDSGGVYNAVYGAQPIECALYIGFHIVGFLHVIPLSIQASHSREQGMPRGGEMDQVAGHHPVAQACGLGR